MVLCDITCPHEALRDSQIAVKMQAQQELGFSIDNVEARVAYTDCICETGER